MLAPVVLASVVMPVVVGSTVSLADTCTPLSLVDGSVGPPVDPSVVDEVIVVLADRSPVVPADASSEVAEVFDAEPLVVDGLPVDPSSPVVPSLVEPSADVDAEVVIVMPVLSDALPELLALPDTVVPPSLPVLPSDAHQPY
jgi:hypothetical protein